ncbi:SHC-transforming protein 1-like [Tubulanus polymorphus]|uniref:SHC-transforming protein 1-like n=1 Tax=Tubulanus polymorphus TaxID=672921 RepID=UPI003DA24697
MASRQKNKKSSGAAAAASGSFMNKPAQGWLHPDEQLSPNAGVCYGVRYIGCNEVKVSMKSLDFDIRTQVAKESIHRVCDAAGLKTASKKRKVDKKVTRFLGDRPSMLYAGSNVNLTVTTESLILTVMETGELIGDHHMQGISFASGGDADTMDFVSYVAKDTRHGRACHVLECGGGLAQDVITTIGQAFELRFKEFLQGKPKPFHAPDRMEAPVFRQMDGESAWGEDPEYYNDRPGVVPPPEIPPPVPPLPQYSAPSCNLPVSGDGQYSSVNDQRYIQGNCLNGFEPHLDDLHDDSLYDNKNLRPINGDSFGAMATPPASLDPFDMQPFCHTLPSDANPIKSENTPNSIGEDVEHEEWFHGPLTRKQAEELLKKSGDFLVRESTTTKGQYVLTGLQNGKVKHLLLVDPQGVVRTKDRTFDSVNHLVSFHRDNNIPIVSHDSELLLQNPICKSFC